MIAEGSLVRMRVGHSGPGLVVEVRDNHPRCDDPTFATIRSKLEKPYALVMWCDCGEREWLWLEEICEINDKGE